MAGGRDAGVDQAWAELSILPPDQVAQRAGASIAPADADADGKVLLVPCLGMTFRVDPARREIISHDPGADILLGKLGYFFRHAMLWYLVRAGEFPETGRPVKPEGLRGGDVFFRGSHMLPLPAVAARYSDDIQGFLARGEKLGGIPAGLGDASIKVYPLPRVPVIVVLWRGDDEFPPGAELLFDSSIELHLPLDVTWCVAMMTVLSFL